MGKRPGFYALVTLLTFMGREEKIRRTTIKKLKLKAGDSVLDVACGTGRNFPYLTEAVDIPGKIVGFDYSAAMLSAAKALCDENRWANIDLIEGDAAELKVGRENFDGIVSALGMSAIPEYIHALKRIKELLKDNGKISVCDARPFSGLLKIFNPLIKPIYKSQKFSCIHTGV